jgi:putative transposase
MNEVHSNKYHMCFLQYHIMFYTNKDILLQNKEKEFIKGYFQNVSVRHEFRIVELGIQDCSVKMTISCKTTHYIPSIMKALKGGSARFLYKQFPDSKLKNGDILWDQKYFIATEDKQLDKMIQRYMDKSKT